jgi:outer membrane protein assembly factor BamB
VVFWRLRGTGVEVNRFFERHAMLGRLWAVTLIAFVASSGCSHGSGGASRKLAALLSHAPRTYAPEKAFTVNWWAKADDTEGRPFRPLEPGEPDSDPSAGRIFVGTADGKVHAFDRHGLMLWEYDAGGPFDAGPTFANGRVYAATSEGELIALDSVSGKKVWEYSTGDELVTKPRVAQGVVLVTSASDTVYAVAEDSGKWLWQYRREAPGPLTLRGAARPLVVSGKVFTGFADGTAVALALKDGDLAWTRSLASKGQFIDVDADPVPDDLGHVFFADFATGLFCLDQDSGATVWTLPRKGITALTITPSGSRVFAGGIGFVASYAAPDGAMGWTLTLGKERAVSGLSVSGKTLLASLGPEALLLLDARSGHLQRAFDPGQGVSAQVAVPAPGQAVVLSNRGFIYNLSLIGRP